MSDEGPFAIDGYSIRCWAELDARNGKYRPMLAFERLADAQLPEVRAIRHQFFAWFPTDREAEQIARERASQLIRDGRTGL